VRFGGYPQIAKGVLKKESVPENVALNAEIKTVRHKAKKIAKADNGIGGALAPHF
jgi:hypothetical protein